MVYQGVLDLFAESRKFCIKCVISMLPPFTVQQYTRRLHSDSKSAEKNIAKPVFKRPADSVREGAILPGSAAFPA